MRREDWDLLREAVLSAIRQEAAVDARVADETTAAARNRRRLLDGLTDGAPVSVEPLTDETGAGIFMLGYSQLDGEDVLG